MEWFLGQNHILQALLATLFTWGVTAIGASLVSFFKTINKKILDSMLGFAAGVMIAASYWSLLAPAIEMSEAQVGSPWVPAVVRMTPILLCPPAFAAAAMVIMTVPVILPILVQLGIEPAAFGVIAAVCCLLGT